MNTTSFNPSCLVKDHKLVFVDKEGRKPIFITEDKAKGIRFYLQKSGSTFFDLTDDEGDYLETIRKTSIKGIEKVYPDAGNSDMRWICDWGYRHMMHEGVYENDDGSKSWTSSNCGCLERFGCAAEQMNLWLYENYGCGSVSEARKHMHDSYLRQKGQVKIRVQPAKTGKDAAFVD